MLDDLTDAVVGCMGDLVKRICGWFCVNLVLGLLGCWSRFFVYVFEMT